MYATVEINLLRRTNAGEANIGFYFNVKQQSYTKRPCLVSRSSCKLSKPYDMGTRQRYIGTYNI